MKQQNDKSKTKVISGTRANGKILQTPQGKSGQALPETARTPIVWGPEGERNKNGGRNCRSGLDQPKCVALESK